MKTQELLGSVVFVAIVASLTTLVVAILFPKEMRELEGEGFDSGLPQQFTPEEEAKLRVLRDKKLFVADTNGVKVNIPIWTKRELRITNASETDGAIRLLRNDGTTTRLAVADQFQGNTGLFTKDRQAYYMLPNARDLVVTNGDGTIHRIQPYTVGYKPDINDAYLGGYPRDPATGNTHDVRYKNKQDAYRECTRIVSTGGQCNGITKNTQTDTYTLRESGLWPSPYGEITTLRF